MTNTEAIRRQYLQKAHDRGGDWQMAMLMMAEQILLLNDALACAQIAAQPGDAVRRFMEPEDINPAFSEWSRTAGAVRRESE